MERKEKKQELVNFLDQRAFNPILERSEDDFDSEAQRKKFRDVKQSTESEKKRFHKYDTAEEVRNNYLGDLNSEAAEKINAELDDLDLPKLPDFKDDFLELCDDIGVKKS